MMEDEYILGDEPLYLDELIEAMLIQAKQRIEKQKLETQKSAS